MEMALISLSIIAVIAVVTSVLQARAIGILLDDLGELEEGVSYLNYRLSDVNEELLEAYETMDEMWEKRGIN